jgi:hypothetical protein
MYIGIDGVNCTIIFKKQTLNVAAVDVFLMNSYGGTYGRVKTIGSQTKLSFNVPLMLRETNLIPYGKDDIEHYAHIEKNLRYDLNKIFGDSIKCIIPNSIEVNITKKLNIVYTHDVIKLFGLTLLEEKGKTFTWMEQGEGINFETRSGIVAPTKVNEYKIKIYDKSKELKNEKGIDIEDNWLRFEIIILGRRIKTIYKENYDLFYILKNPEPLICRFEYIYKIDIRNKIKNKLKIINSRLFEELTQGITPKDVFGRYRNLIVDRKQIQKCLETYYKFAKKQNQSIALSKRIANAYLIGEGIIKEALNLL